MVHSACIRESGGQENDHMVSKIEHADGGFTSSSVLFREANPKPAGQCVIFMKSSQSAVSVSTVKTHFTDHARLVTIVT